MAERVIEIPAIQLKTIVVGIEGTTPLITNRFSERSIQEIEAKQQKRASMKKEARVPEREFQDHLHVISDGVYGYPAGGIKKTLVKAGGRFTEEKMTHLRGVLTIVGDLVEIKADEPTMRTDNVRLKGGVTSIVYRPQFWPWEMDIPVTYNCNIMSESQILNLFQIAGFAVGLGAWRPDCDGTFGQFKIKEGGVQG